MIILITNHGNTKNTGNYVIRVYYNAIVYPTQYPTNSPIKLLDNTSTNDSYMYNNIILNLELPIALNTAISFTYSIKFADIDDDNEKKQRTITIAVNAVKIVVIRL